jgi:hypothetical protein
VDWDADGDRDLLVTVNGVPTVYRNDQALGGGFTLAAKLQVKGVFGLVAVDVNGGRGKDLIIGKINGKLAYMASSATKYAAPPLQQPVTQGAGVVVAPVVPVGFTPAPTPVTNANQK